LSREVDNARKLNAHTMAARITGGCEACFEGVEVALVVGTISITDDELSASVSRAGWQSKTFALRKGTYALVLLLACAPIPFRFTSLQVQANGGADGCSRVHSTVVPAHHGVFEVALPRQALRPRHVLRI
jgi:hypothetical protein